MNVSIYGWALVTRRDNEDKEKTDRRRGIGEIRRTRRGGTRRTRRDKQDQKMRDKQDKERNEDHER